jgi:hypothetical protein
LKTWVLRAYVPLTPHPSLTRHLAKSHVIQDNDAIDLTDNDISALANFPLQPRLRTLFLAQNRIATIAPTLSSSIPNLTTLVLAKNRIAELADLDPLTGFKKLTHVSLLGNPVANKEHYRAWLVWRVPSVRFLDFIKVTERERQRARDMFGTSEEPTELATKVRFHHAQTYLSG